MSLKINVTTCNRRTPYSVGTPYLKEELNFKRISQRLSGTHRTPYPAGTASLSKLGVSVPRDSIKVRRTSLGILLLFVPVDDVEHICPQVSIRQQALGVVRPQRHGLLVTRRQEDELAL